MIKYRQERKNPNDKIIVLRPSVTLIVTIYLNITRKENKEKVEF